MERAAKSAITIKGTRDGLIFRLDDSCSFSELVQALKQKLTDDEAKLLDGPDTSVTVSLGKRKISHDEEMRLRQLIALRPNLVITNIVSDSGHYRSDFNPLATVQSITGTVRSGQVVQTEASLLLLGDVNPGGTVKAGGDIFVFGRLSGVAHAGSTGTANAIIAAVHMAPTQLRIASVISRSPDENNLLEGTMEFAYINDQSITIEKIDELHKIRPQLTMKTTGLVF